MPESTTFRTRTVSAGFELRDHSDGAGLTLAGYAAVFNAEAHGEVVMPTAFNRTLDHQADVRLLVNHDGVPLARTASGTLALTVDDRGLHAEAELDPANPDVQRLASAMRRGDIDQMSFAFRPVRDETNDAGVRELHELELFDVSVVTYPWYDVTTVELNSLHRALDKLARGRHLDADERAELLDRLDADTAITPDESDGAVDGEMVRNANLARLELARQLLSA